MVSLGFGDLAGLEMKGEAGPSSDGSVAALKRLLYGALWPAMFCWANVRKKFKGEFPADEYSTC